MQKYKKVGARILSLALSAAMVCTMFPRTVFAEEGIGTPLGSDSIRVCHMKHDESCGFIAKRDGHECIHVHEELCYETTGIATIGDANGLVCIHNHNEECGFVAIVEGSPCTHSCEICQSEKGKETEVVLSESAQVFVDRVEAIDENNLIELVSAYRDAFDAYYEEETDGASVEELAQRLADSEKEFIAAYGVVESVDGNSVLEWYELLTDEEKVIEQVKAAKETLDSMIAAVAEIRPTAQNSRLRTEAPVTTFPALQRAINNASTDSANPTKIEIGADFDLTATLKLSGKHVSLTSASGEAFTLTRAANFTGVAFAIESGGSIILEHITIDGNKSNVTSAGVLVDVKGSAFTLEDGGILQNNKNSAIKISLANAIVTMNEGKIAGNSADRGAAVCFTNTSTMEFIMNGGEISDNTVAENGSAICESGYNTEPVITIAGGEIKNNTANGQFGGAIYSNGTLNIIDGTISGNAAPNGKSCGVYKTSKSSFTMTGGALENNTAEGKTQNIYLRNVMLTIGGDAKIQEGLTLDAGTENNFLSVSSALTGSIGIDIVGSPKVGDVVVKASDGYTLTNSDKDKFSYADGRFEFVLDTMNNQIKLVSPAGVPEATANSIYAKGTPLILAAGSSSPTKTVIYIDINNNGIVDVDTDKIWAPADKDTTTEGNSLSFYSIFGGERSSNLIGDTNITMLGGKVSSIYGGSNRGNVIGETHVTVSGGTVTSDVYGGGYEGVVTENTNVSMTNGSVRNLYGGGSGGGIDSEDVLVSGNSNVIVSGGTAVNVFGCGQYGSVGENVTISVSDGTISDSVYGGTTDGRYPIECNIAISITGGTVTNHVYTGGYMPSNPITGTKSVTVGGYAKIGSVSGKSGIAINGKTKKNGVDSVRIAPDLAADASINVNLQYEYPSPLVDNPIIAMEAVEEDLKKIALVGSSAAGLEAYFDSSDSTIRLKYATKVQQVSVTPDSVLVPLNGTKQFEATVTGTGNPAQTVTWTVSGGVVGTLIDPDGKLTVAADEMASVLTVKATSAVDPKKFGIASVKVQKLSGIAIKTAPDKTEYLTGEVFDKSGMVIMAHYSEGNDFSEKTITNYTISPDRPLTLSDTSITVSYTDFGVEKTVTQPIRVREKINAVPPTITENLDEIEVVYHKDEAANELSIAAAANDGGTLSYQWYSNTKNNTTDGTKLNHTAPRYKPSTSALGTSYYYCVVTNTIADNNDGGTKTAEITSKVAKVTVKPVFASVTNITEVPSTAIAGTELTLSGTVIPDDAINKNIMWSIKDAGATGATVSGSILNTLQPGTVIVTAAIINGLTETSDYMQDFTIVVRRGGSGSSTAASHESVTYYVSLPENYKGGTKIIGNVQVPDYTIEGTWFPTGEGTWRLHDKNGNVYTEGWAAVFNPHADVPKGQSAFDWFLFDAAGNMMTGWYTDELGHTYYLNPSRDNTQGTMAVGWKVIDGNDYYFNKMPDGTRGKLLKGTITPDGYHVDEYGIWKK